MPPLLRQKKENAGTVKLTGGMLRRTVTSCQITWGVFRFPRTRTRHAWKAVEPPTTVRTIWMSLIFALSTVKRSSDST